MEKLLFKQTTLDSPMDLGFSSTIQEDVEDHAFYAELTRRILLLTDEDDEVQVKNKGLRRFNQNIVSGGGGGGGQWSLMHGNYFSWSEGGEFSVPGWMEKLWKASGGGTGVFIPRGGMQRRRRRYNKPKKNNDMGKGYQTSGHKNLVSSS